MPERVPRPSVGLRDGSAAEWCRPVNELQVLYVIVQASAICLLNLSPLKSIIVRGSVARRALAMAQGAERADLMSSSEPRSPLSTSAKSSAHKSRSKQSPRLSVCHYRRVTSEVWPRRVCVPVFCLSCGGRAAR